MDQEGNLVDEMIGVEFVLTVFCIVECLVYAQPMMEETVLIADDLMLGPASPLIPPDIASHVLDGVNLCDGILRNLFLCKFFTHRMRV